jgi:hypothetical protein
LRAEILLRTQGSEEKLLVYFAAMDNLFHRLLTPLSEEEQLSIVKKNVHPYFFDRLTLQVIPDLARLYATRLYDR